MPTVVVVLLLFATHGATLRGALIGFVCGVALLVFVLLSVYVRRYSVLDFALDIGLYGSCGAWLGAALHAIGQKYNFVGFAALGLFVLSVVLFYLLLPDIH